ncbi:hypothetical protein ACK3BK_01530 [Pseudomonas sp. L7]|uniref:hypothetical protein n=1 Tax=Pseudomonas sp. L7 TaxID=3388343 RepID=UPI003984B245
MTQLQFVALMFTTTVGLGFIIYIEWKKYRLDKLRFELFRIRDELFVSAEEGKLSFEDESYKITRASLNGMIRYSHDLSFMDVFLVTRAGKQPYYAARRMEHEKRARDAYSQLGREGKAAIKKAMKSMHIAVFSHIAFNSIGAIIITSTLFFMFVVELLVAKASKRTKSVAIQNSQSFSEISERINALDTEAYEIGRCAA